MYCYCCASTKFTQHTILWKGLIDAWRLTPQEAIYVNRQQGLMCDSCGTNLRSIVLAQSIMRCFNYRGIFNDFVEESAFQGLKILEINNAGHISKMLGKLPGVVQKSYPGLDMMQIEFGDNSFDLVIHADDLEHVRNPVRGLAECRRVLKPGGFCTFTIPMVVGRLTSSREGLAGSYHGPAEPKFQVWTEFGSDAWEYVIKAGFTECRIVSLEYPTAQAFVGVKSPA